MTLPRPPRPSLACLPLLALLAACGPAFVKAPEAVRSYAPEIVTKPLGSPPPRGPEGSCWSAQISPAVIETVTEQILDGPALTDARGQVIRPASYRTVTRQAIVRERSEQWFQSPCPEMMTADFLASAQRALKARRLYSGPITGALDAPTTEAIRRFQAARDLDSGLLSLAAAEDLGLIAVGTDL